MKRVILNILIILFAFIIILALMTFINGSLEAFPTDEQIEKTRISSAMVGFFSLMVELFLIRLRLKK